MAKGKRVFSAQWLGQVAYGPTHERQKELMEARTRGEIGDTILALEHNRVVTLGRGAHSENVLLSTEALQAQGYEIHETGRGGDVTYHGPGQLVLYPIVDLKPDRQDVRKYVQSLEETMIRTCADLGIAAERKTGFNGTWVGESKIGAVGVRLSRWVTMHGLALNVSTKLSDFDVIVPCGIADKRVTSVLLETGSAPSVREVAGVAVAHLASLYDADVCWVG